MTSVFLVNRSRSRFIEWFRFSGFFFREKLLKLYNTDNTVDTNGNEGSQHRLQPLSWHHIHFTSIRSVDIPVEFYSNLNIAYELRFSLTNKISSTSQTCRDKTNASWQQSRRTDSSWLIVIHRMNYRVSDLAKLLTRSLMLICSTRIWNRDSNLRLHLSFLFFARISLPFNGAYFHLPWCQNNCRIEYSKNGCYWTRISSLLTVTRRRLNLSM